MNSVEKRRRAILEAITQRRIETQDQLVDTLADLGFEVSQASVSRDIATLRLVKVDGRWTAPPTELPTADTYEQRIVGRLTSVSPSGNHLLVLKTPPGEAQGVALALDNLTLEGVVGTIAGDDTIFIATVDARAGERLAAKLEPLISP